MADQFCVCCMKFHGFVNWRNVCSLCEDHCSKDRCCLRIYPEDYSGEKKSNE